MAKKGKAKGMLEGPKLSVFYRDQCLGRWASCMYPDNQESVGTFGRTWKSSIVVNCFLFNTVHVFLASLVCLGVFGSRVGLLNICLGSRVSCDNTAILLEESNNERVKPQVLPKIYQGVIIV